MSQFQYEQKILNHPPIEDGEVYRSYTLDDFLQENYHMSYEEFLRRKQKRFRYKPLFGN